MNRKAIKKKESFKEKRKLPRIDAKIEIYRADEEMAWKTKNLSMGGCFVGAKALLPRNRGYYPLKFLLPDNDFVITTLGRVKHYGQEKAGMGIQFLGMGGKGRKLLLNFIKSQLR